MVSEETDCLGPERAESWGHTDSELLLVRQGATPRRCRGEGMARLGHAQPSSLGVCLFQDKATDG